MTYKNLGFNWRRDSYDSQLILVLLIILQINISNKLLILNLHSGNAHYFSIDSGNFQILFKHSQSF